jgi:HEAT repeat protein
MVSPADQLILSLLSDPSAFTDKGSAYSLLQEYFAGYPIDTLRPLLRHEDALVQRAAVWVASELGAQAGPLLGDVLPLLRSEDRYLAYYALEVVAVCATGEQTPYLTEVLAKLESEDPVLRVLAMRLIGNTDDESLRTTLGVLQGRSASERHRAGLALLLSDGQEKWKRTVMELLKDEEPLLRKYGAIMARRALAEAPELIQEAATSEDEDVRSYAEEVIDVHRARMS